MTFKPWRRPSEEAGGPTNPPQRVCVEVNGVTYMLDESLKYEGINDHGLHSWYVQGPLHETFTEDSQPKIHIERMPGHTGINLRIIRTPGGVMRFAGPDD